jgi:hypothetical protein
MTGHPDMQKIQITGFFFENRLQWQSEVERKFKKSVLGYIFIYVQNKTLIHNSFYEIDKRGKNLSHKKM